MPVPITVWRKELVDFVHRKKVIFTQLKPDVDLTVETWLNSCHNYTDARKMELLNVYNVYYGQLRDVMYTLVKSFIKDEAYPEYKSPRGIMSRSDQFKVLVGPLIKQIENLVYQLPQFIKHVPIIDRPNFIKERFSKNFKKYNYTSDYTAFESHFVKSLMEDIEFIVYDHIVATCPEAKEIMEYFKSVISGPQRLLYGDLHVDLSDSIRCSGEMNTSLGNGIANLMIMWFLCEKFGDPDPNIQVEGDDAITNTNAILKTEYFSNLGLTCKLDQHEDISTTSFCGMIFDFENGINIIDPIKTLLKTPWAGYKYAFAKKPKLLELLRAKALSIAHANPGCPIVQSYAHYLLRMTRGSKANFADCNQYMLSTNRYIKDETNIPYIDTPMSTRLLMQKVFGIPISTQLLLESYFDNKNDLEPICLPLLYTYFNSDQVDYYDNYVREHINPSQRSVFFFTGLVNEDAEEIYKYV